MNRVCPKCRTQTLKVVPRYRFPREVEDPPLACSRCGGMWTTVEEVSHLAIGEPDFLADLEIEGDADPADIDARGGLCPEGHGLLIRAYVHTAQSPFFLDRCMTCSGIWFDRGEWEALARSHLLDDIQDLWTSTWQRKQRQTLSRDEHLAWARSLFGEEMLGLLLRLAETLRGHAHSSEALAFLREEAVARAARVPEDDSPSSASAASVELEARAASERVAARDVPAEDTDEPPTAASARAAMPPREPEPPVTEPPVEEPPVTEPPVEEPPVEEPPVEEPPVEEPPIEEPPVEEPPEPKPSADVEPPRPDPEPSPQHGESPPRHEPTPEVAPKPKRKPATKRRRKPKS